MHTVFEDGNDPIRGRFTAYMEKVVYHAKIDYVRKHTKQIQTVSLEEVSPMMSMYEYDWQLGLAIPNEFNFAEQKLSNAFSDLPILRQQILKLIFIQGLSAQEVALKMNCSVEYVYKQKHLALKRLRDKLISGRGACDEE